MKKAMLSQPMAGKTEAEIITTRSKAIAELSARGYEIVNTLFTDEWYSKESMAARGVVQIPLCFLSKSLENMSLCHAAYFCKGWENARGCRIEHEAALAYGLEIIYEDNICNADPEDKCRSVAVPDADHQLMCELKELISKKENALQTSQSTMAILGCVAPPLVGLFPQAKDGMEKELDIINRTFVRFCQIVEETR